MLYPYPLARRLAHLRPSLPSRPRTRALSSRAAAILSALNIPEPGRDPVSGVYNGRWGGTGEPLKSICPSTGELLAHVSTVSLFVTAASPSFTEIMRTIVRLHPRNWRALSGYRGRRTRRSEMFRRQSAVKSFGRFVKLWQPRFD
jgi:hypothetical protein